jgi:hypothetical protein
MQKVERRATNQNNNQPMTRNTFILPAPVVQDMRACTRCDERKARTQYCGLNVFEPCLAFLLPAEPAFVEGCMIL